MMRRLVFWLWWWLCETTCVMKLPELSTHTHTHRSTSETQKSEQDAQIISVNILILYNGFIRCYHWRTHGKRRARSLYYLLHLHVNLQWSQTEKFDLKKDWGRIQSPGGQNSSCQCFEELMLQRCVRTGKAVFSIALIWHPLPAERKRVESMNRASHS